MRRKNTGFREKNNKKIYVGDILCYKNPLDGYQEYLVKGGLLEWGLFVERHSPITHIFPLRQEYISKYGVVKSEKTTESN